MKTENAYKRKKQPEIVRRALLDQAARITLEQGLSKVTFQAVADAVGVTKGGVMHHFTTKNALILEVFHDAMKKFETEVDTAMAKGEGLFWVQPVAKTVRQILRAVERRRHVAVVTRRWRIAAWLLRHLPESLYLKM